MKSELNKKAAKAGIWYTIANMLLKGCVFFTLPIFTRLLSTTDFGIYNTYIAYEGILTAILGLGLYGTVKNAKYDFKEDFDKYLSSVLSMSITVLLLVLLFANAFYPLYDKFIGFSRFIVNCLVFQSFGSFLIYFYGSKLNVEFKYKPYILMSFFNTLGNILSSILLIIYVFPNEKYLGRILGSAIPIIVIGIIVVGLLWYKGKTFYNFKYWKYAFLLGFPLIPHVISQSLLTQFDRIMITNMISASKAGIYSYIYTICTIMYVICTSFDNAWTPWVFANLSSEKYDTIKKVSKDYVSFFALLTLGFICVMPEITKVIADQSYWEGIDLLIPLSLANYFIFLYMLPVNIEYYNKKTKFISIGTISAALVNLILNYICIILFGYSAAAYTTLVSYSLLYLFHLKIAQKNDFNQIYDIKFLSKVTIVLIISSIIVLITLRNYYSGLVLRYLIIIVILLILLKNKDRIIDFLKGLKNEKRNI